MALPNYYITGSGLSPSYNYLDMVSGCGYRNFYPCSGAISGATAEYFLSTTSIDAAAGLTTITGVMDQTLFTQELDQTFKVYFKTPAYVKGTGYVNFSYWVNGQSTFYWIVDVYVERAAGGAVHVGSEIGKYKSKAAALAYYRECMKIDLTNCHISIGDDLMFEISMYGKKDDTGNCNFALYIDPSSRQTINDGSSIVSGTDLTLSIPFKIVT